MGSIRLHREFGLNPTMPVCIYCGEPDGSIALLGAAYKGEAPAHMVVGRDPCAKCREAWKVGIAILEAEDAEPHHATGRHIVITEEAARRIFGGMDKEMFDEVMEKRVCKVPGKVIDHMLASHEAASKEAEDAGSGG